MPAPASLLVDVPRLVTAYYAGHPSPDIDEQRVAFGTSGHRGTSQALSFNEAHILAITEAICRFRAALLADGLRDVARIPFARAWQATSPYDYFGAYVAGLEQVIDMDVLRGAKIALGVDPLGGASLDYWPAIAERFGFQIEVVNPELDPTFRFMTVDWDGRIRMDPSSAPAMARLIALRERFDVAFATDPDADRHGVVTRTSGLLDPNHYLAAAVDYLFANRPNWSRAAAVGKTVVTSSIIDRVVSARGRRLFEVPVGFKYFVDGFLSGALGFGGEESAGASFLQRDGGAWSTDKDGIIMGLLAAELTARTGRDPGERYRQLVHELGEPIYERIDVHATREQKSVLAQLTPHDFDVPNLAGERVCAVTNAAPGTGDAIGGIKVSTENGWFAARPSGTEDVYKLYAESFTGADHLRRIQEQARGMIDAVLAGH
ncbi:MAG: phosphoglucomutase, alpha-D-glucose phosphate-specific [Pseudomonadota bacterium]